MKRSVLLVEGSELLCEAVADGFTSMGLEVHVAHDGAGAIELLKERTFNAVFVDLELPNGMDGIQLAWRANVCDRRST